MDKVEYKNNNKQTWIRFPLSAKHNELIRTIQIKMELRTGVRVKKEELAQALILESAQKRVNEDNCVIEKLLENENS